MGKVNIGIPSERTERIITLNRDQNSICESENGEYFISIPALFKLEHCAAHGLVLKSTNGEDRIVLMLPKIDIELEIPDENIYNLPNVLAGNFKYFCGTCFTDNKPVLILNTNKLSEIIK